jgi:hypothetical protein
MCSLRQAANTIAAHFSERAIRVVQAHRERVCIDPAKQQQTVSANTCFSIAPIASNTWPINFCYLSVAQRTRLASIEDQKVVSQSVVLRYGNID